MTPASPLVMRPLGLGELLDQAIRLYRRNFLRFIGLVAVPLVPVTVLGQLADWLFYNRLFREADFSPILSFVVPPWSTLAWVISTALVHLPATAALARLLADQHLGQRTGILDAYRRLGRAWWALAGAVALVVSHTLLIFAWWACVPCVGWISGLGLFLFFTRGGLPLIGPVIALEGQRPWPGIWRAWDLARRRVWWLMGFLIIIFLFGQLAVTGPVAILNLLLLRLGVDQLQTGSAALNLSLASVVPMLTRLAFDLLYLPVQITVFTLLYFDLRVRTEGLDLALQAGPDAAVVMAQPPAGEPKRWLTAMDIGAFSVVTLGLLGLYFVFFFLIFLMVFSFELFP